MFRKLILFLYFPLFLIGCKSAQAPESSKPLVIQEFRYNTPGAEEVTLVWGTDGWQPIELEFPPAGTQVKNGVMQTPMAKEGDEFVTRLALPPWKEVNYGFLVRQASQDSGAEDEWDGKDEYLFITTNKNRVIRVPPEEEQLSSQAPSREALTDPATVEIRYRQPRAGAVFLVWGINGWEIVPEELRPDGTIVKNKVMQTPMAHDGEEFSAKLSIPLGAYLDYGFLITATSTGAAVNVWDTNEAQPGQFAVIGNWVILVESRQRLKEPGSFDWVNVLPPVLLLWIGTALVVLVVSKLFPEAISPRWTLIILLFLVVVGLVLRINATSVWNSYQPDSAERLLGDEPDYDNTARELLAGQGFTWPGRVPLYSAWLALVYGLSGGSYRAVPYIQAFLGLSTVILSYILGTRVFKSSTAGLVAAGWAAVSYILISQGLHLLSEVLYTPVLLMLVLALRDALDDPSTRRFAWAGVWVGLSNLVRPSLLLFPLFVAILMFFLLNKRKAFAFGFIYLVSSAAIVTPWIIHNYIRYHAIFPLQTSNAILWQGSPEYYHLISDQVYSYQRVWTEILYGPGGQDPNSIAGDRYWTHRALRSIAAEPRVYIQFALEKLITYWLGDPSADWGGKPLFSFQGLKGIGFNDRDALEVLIARAIPILTLIALVNLRPKWRSLFPVVALLIYMTGLHALTHAEARLSEPLQPFLLLIIAGAVAYWAETRGGQVAVSSRSSHSPTRLTQPTPLRRQ